MHKSQPEAIAERNARIVALAQAGMHPKKIAAEYGVTHARICQILRAALESAELNQSSPSTSSTPGEAHD